MSRRFCKTISMLLTIVLVSGLFPGNLLLADSEPSDEQMTESSSTSEDSFPYAVFAGSTDDDLSFYGWKCNITGDIYSGRDFVFQGSELNMNGFARTAGAVQPSERKENMTGAEEGIEPLLMPMWGDAIKAYETRLPSILPEELSSQDSIEVNGYFYSENDITINGTSFSGDAIIVSKGNITYNVCSLNTEGKVILYSEEGDIHINGTQIGINGILYAPNGRVTINAYDVTINGRIVADKFSYSGSILNITADPSDLTFLQDITEPTPDITPTEEPTQAPTEEPTETPSPTEEPTVSPSVTTVPTEEPTVEPTEEPTVEPTDIPSDTPTPTVMPTGAEEIIINLNTDQFGVRENDPLLYIYGVIDSVCGTLSDSCNVTRLSYTISSQDGTVIKSGDIPVAEEWSTEEIGFFLGRTIITFEAESEDGTIVSKDYVFFSFTDRNAEKLGVDINTDTDHDLLSDYVESVIGTDAGDPDSDKDGISDGVEVRFLLTDPCLIDSDGNGISDGNEDIDNDGLSYLEEIEYSTLFYKDDTDLDGIKDGDEIKICNTDPDDSDTDKDGITDGNEIMIGKDPLDDADGRIKIDQLYTKDISNSEDQSLYRVEVRMELEDLINSVLYVEDVYKMYPACTDIYGMKGSPVSFDCKEEFETATVTFYYDENNLSDGTNEDNLGILWYDEENRCFVVQDNAVVNTTDNTVTLETDHFSIYSLVDLNMWNDPIRPDYSDTVFTVHDEIDIVEWAGREKSLDEQEISNFAWWKLSNGSGYSILARLNGEKILTKDGEYIQHWHYVYDWLVMDDTDEDNDDIPDVLETNGMLGTDGKTYYSRVPDDDTDDDGVSDGGEMGQMYIVTRVDETTVDINGERIDLSEPASLMNYNGNIRLGMAILRFLPQDIGAVCVLFDVVSDVQTPDMDKDGLYDTMSRKWQSGYQEIVIVPVDPDADKKNAPTGLIDKHVETISSNDSTAYYTVDRQVPELEEGDLRYALSWIGSYTLGFYNDEKGIAVHSCGDQIQEYFGYTDLYDTFFRLGTLGNVGIMKLAGFDYNGDKYMFWLWRGNYLNLGTGAEIGLYYKPQNINEIEDDYAKEYYSYANENGIDLWAASPVRLKMELNLYSKDTGEFRPISNWHPNEYQWWITTFNYHEPNPRFEDLYVVAKISFRDGDISDDSIVDLEEMYYCFKRQQLRERSDDPTTIIFDDDGLCIYLIWGEGIMYNAC